MEELEDEGMHPKVKRLLEQEFGHGRDTTRQDEGFESYSGGRIKYESYIRDGELEDKSF